MKKGVISTDIEETQRITIDYYEHLYTYTLNNLMKQKKHFKLYSHSRQDKKDIESLNKPIETEAVIKTLPLDQMDLQVSSTTIQRWTGFIFPKTL